jgi:hypothetical protein
MARHYANGGRPSAGIYTKGAGTGSPLYMKGAAAYSRGPSIDIGSTIKKGAEIAKDIGTIAGAARTILPMIL